jgi:chromate transporter
MDRAQPTPTVEATSLVKLALLFLKPGAIAFAGPTAHIAMMEDEVVGRLRWLTREEFLDLLGALLPWLSESHLLDAVAFGQVTPGPVFTTATFIGYVLGGRAGAFVATVGIFLPWVLSHAPSYSSYLESLILRAFDELIQVSA